MQDGGLELEGKTGRATKKGKPKGKPGRKNGKGKEEGETG